MQQLWTVFSELTDKVRADHIQHDALGGCHDLLHAFMVAQYAQRIADDEESATLGWVAGICHNADRMFGHTLADSFVEEYLTLVPLDSVQKKRIAKAVLMHSTRDTLDEDDVLVVLKDADRLANSGPVVWLRAGQFLPRIPSVDPRYVLERDPLARYNDPRSLLENMRNALEWESWLRKEKAKILAKPYFDGLRTLIEGIRAQLEETELFPFPFPEDYTKLSRECRMKRGV